MLSARIFRSAWVLLYPAPQGWGNGLRTLHTHPVPSCSWDVRSCCSVALATTVGTVSLSLLYVDTWTEPTTHETRTRMYNNRYGGRS
jgi:hypothetical protein